MDILSIILLVLLILVACGGLIGWATVLREKKHVEFLKDELYVESNDSEHYRRRSEVLQADLEDAWIAIELAFMGNDQELCNSHKMLEMVLEELPTPTVTQLQGVIA